MAETHEFVGVTEAGRMLRLSDTRVRQLADGGSLECERTALGRLISVASIERLATERAERAGATAGLPA